MLRRLFLLVGACFVLLAASPGPEPLAQFHFAPNGNFDSAGRFGPGAFGFNMSDVAEVGDLGRLPPGVVAMVWVGQCNGVDDRFVATVSPFLRNPKVFGFYLMDDPDPRFWHGRQCLAENLRAEADWLHARAPRAKTFVMLMNLGSARNPSFEGSYNPANTHVDLFGLSPYPCRTELSGCDFDMIRRFFVAAVKSGIPAQRIIPGYQAFGGGEWTDDGGGQYALPSVDHERAILAHWSKLISRPQFDYVYSWASQRDDGALQSSPELQAFFAEHNAGRRMPAGARPVAAGDHVP